MLSADHDCRKQGAPLAFAPNGDHSLTAPCYIALGMMTDCQERMLLTGAGFTKNFGGPLAKELWSVIFSNPVLDNAPDVRETLRRDFDFESVYNDVMNGARLPADMAPSEPSWKDQQQALRVAVSEAYAYIDEKVRAFVFRRDAPYAVNIYKVQDFVARFSGTPKKPGFFFTLNQDLFIERKHYNGVAPTLPGIPPRPTWFTTDSTSSLDAERVVLPTPAEATALNLSGFNYVKLHGSSNWYTADQQTMVIGHAKRDQIAARPLLAAYLGLFRSALAIGDRRLLCVGYSFFDEHINAAIMDGTKKGLRLYILSPEAPDILAERLKSQSEAGAHLWRAVSGYFQTDLKTLFPPDQSVTPESKRLESQFFLA
jgi:hypothetical protein